ncbi:MAG: TolB-like translocation protein [Anaerolineae bacterium]
MMLVPITLGGLLLFLLVVFMFSKTGQELVSVLWKLTLLVAAGGAVLWGLSVAFRAIGNLRQYGTLNHAQAQARAEATSQADANDRWVQEARQLADDGDYYLAAALAQYVLARQPDNPGAQDVIGQLASHVTGGLIIGNTYQPFASTQVVTFLDDPGGDVVAASRDGTQVVVRQGDAATPTRGLYQVDLTTGGVEYRGALPSPDFGKWTRTADYFYLEGTLVVESPYGSQPRTIECARAARFQWSPDSRFVSGFTRDGVLVVDVDQGTCTTVPISGMGSDVSATFSDGRSVWIVLSGDYASMNRSRLFVANMDGSGLRQVAELYITGRDRDASTLMSPDFSAIYFSEGWMASTRTGNWTSAPSSAIAWVDSPPPRAIIGDVAVGVDPSSGPRGTNFTFRLVGGLPGAQFSWHVDPDGTTGYPIGFCSTGGTYEGSDFSFRSDIDSTAGPHRLTIYQGEKAVASATFTITE